MSGKHDVFRRSVHCDSVASNSPVSGYEGQTITLVVDISFLRRRNDPMSIHMIPVSSQEFTGRC